MNIDNLINNFQQELEKPEITIIGRPKNANHTPETRANALLMREKGILSGKKISHIKIANEYGLNVSTVARWCKEYFLPELEHSPSFKCPRCKRKSYATGDIKNEYCIVCGSLKDLEVNDG